MSARAAPFYASWTGVGGIRRRRRWRRHANMLFAMIASPQYIHTHSTNATLHIRRSRLAAVRCDGVLAPYLRVKHIHIYIYHRRATHISANAFGCSQCHHMSVWMLLIISYQTLKRVMCFSCTTRLSDVYLSLHVRCGITHPAYVSADQTDHVHMYVAYCVVCTARDQRARGWTKQTARVHAKCWRISLHFYKISASAYTCRNGSAHSRRIRTNYAIRCSTRGRVG